MKYLLFLFVSVWVSTNIQAQVPNKEVCDKYKAAFDHILRDSVNRDKTIYVMDSIVDLDRHFFIEQLSDCPEQQTILEKEKMKFDWAEDQYSPILNRLFDKFKNAKVDKILLFSDIKDNMLVANCVDKKLNQSAPIQTWSVEFIISFAESFNYLFLFDDEGIIKSVYRIKMHYD